MFSCRSLACTYNAMRSYLTLGDNTVKEKPALSCCNILKPLSNWLAQYVGTFPRTQPGPGATWMRADTVQSSRQSEAALRQVYLKQGNASPADRQALPRTSRTPALWARTPAGARRTRGATPNHGSRIALSACATPADARLFCAAPYRKDGCAVVVADCGTIRTADCGAMAVTARRITGLPNCIACQSYANSLPQSKHVT